MLRYFYLLMSILGSMIVFEYFYLQGLTVADLNVHVGRLSGAYIEKHAGKRFSIFNKPSKRLLINLDDDPKSYRLDDEAYHEAFLSSTDIGDTISIYNYTGPHSFISMISDRDALQIEKNGVIIYDLLDHRFYSSRSLLYGVLLSLLFMYLFITEGRSKKKSPH